MRTHKMLVFSRSGGWQSDTGDQRLGSEEVRGWCRCRVVQGHVHRVTATWCGSLSPTLLACRRRKKLTAASSVVLYAVCRMGQHVFADAVENSELQSILDGGWCDSYTVQMANGPGRVGPIPTNSQRKAGVAVLATRHCPGDQRSELGIVGNSYSRAA